MPKKGKKRVDPLKIICLDTKSKQFFENMTKD
jgi:hypothetical protein